MRAVPLIALLRQGELAGAHDALKRLYSSFSEGFDTPDLQQAAGLIAGPPS